LSSVPRVLFPFAPLGFFLRLFLPFLFSRLLPFRPPFLLSFRLLCPPTSPPLSLSLHVALPTFLRPCPHPGFFLRLCHRFLFSRHLSFRPPLHFSYRRLCCAFFRLLCPRRAFRHRSFLRPCPHPGFFLRLCPLFLFSCCHSFCTF